jgi:hypothetical protein
LEKVRTHFKQKSRLIAALRAAEPKLNARAGKKEGGWVGRNFCPPSLSPLLFSPPQFFVPMKLARRI